jgi:hypothetical protein
VYTLLVHSDEQVRRVAVKLVQSLDLIKYVFFLQPLNLLLNILIFL